MHQERKWADANTSRAAPGDLNQREAQMKRRMEFAQERGLAMAELQVRLEFTGPCVRVVCWLPDSRHTTVWAWLLRCCTQAKRQELMAQRDKLQAQMEDVQTRRGAQLGRRRPKRTEDSLDGIIASVQDGVR